MDGLYKVVTDNGSNIVAAFQGVLKIHVDTMFLDEPSEEEEDEENEEDEIYSMETEILLQYDFYCLIAAISKDLILGQCSLAYSVLRPFVAVGDFAFLQRIGRANIGFCTLRALVGKFKHSDLLSSTGKILVKASSTDGRRYPVSRGVYNMMKIMVDVLKRIQGEKVVTISHAYGFVKAMKRGVAKFKENLETRNLAEALLKLIDDRFCVMYDALHLSF
uniref:Uncharacterized protein n=1 Tax=Ditylenchus dipsaci TaxID=166011 RepID=A0A915E877_9BILA